MFDGVDPNAQANVTQARYWGRFVGVQGFFLNRIMSTWQSDVGNDPANPVWQKVRQFQFIYSRHGMVDNFLKVAIWNRHDWRDAAANAQVIENFANGAALAKYAGFKGVALDTEPYVPIWGGDAGGPELAPTVYKVGKAIGRAMHQAYPAMTLFLIDDTLYWANRGETNRGGNALSVPFLRGLFSAGFSHVVIGTELTYDDPAIATVTEQALGEYRKFFETNGLPPANISIAPGLWPLGRSYQNKSARMSPSQFEELLRAAFSTAPDYVWIYGYGSAWQTGGPYGEAKVTKRFKEYTAVLHRVQAACAKNQRLSGHKLRGYWAESPLWTNGRHE